MVAVVLSQDSELGPACAAELRSLGAEVHLVVDAAEVTDLGTQGLVVDTLVAVPQQPQVGEAAADGPAVFAGEVGLGGELRSVGHMERRGAEAAKLGFTRLVCPAVRSGDNGGARIKTSVCGRLAEAVKAALAGAQDRES